ncbi:hypothetical protein FEAC_19250 [Ferrimicrobium acidiphilum DSM 19497]|uniref:Uncharacterized protein n=1 Tax=Ferrimicrobium acidiphilum DSM 19497 TaxID=1121877 RepID=A0A0D8FSR8_9ACTN|nr:hypothetical protein FEAC_19250 [Ferrimicrobium acidiphilum DSM 19497]
MTFTKFTDSTSTNNEILDAFVSMCPWQQAPKPTDHYRKQESTLERDPVEPLNNMDSLLDECRAPWVPYLLLV